LPEAFLKRLFIANEKIGSGRAVLYIHDKSYIVLLKPLAVMKLGATKLFSQDGK